MLQYIEFDVKSPPWYQRDMGISWKLWDTWVFEIPDFFRSKIIWDSRIFWDPGVLWDLRALSKSFNIFKRVKSENCQECLNCQKCQYLKIAKSLPFFGIFRDSAITSLPTPRLSGVSSLYISPLPDSQSSTLLSGRTTEETNTFCNLDKYILKLVQIIDWVPHCCQGGQLRRGGLFASLVLW